jgi:choline dehydrogenase-like flavoprotein
VERLGLPGQFLTRSAPGCVGCGVCQMGCPSGGKWSVDRTFLRVAEAQGGVRTIADLRVVGVVVEGDRLLAVTGQRIDPATLLPAGEVRVEASVFVLSAGPIGSPRFLMRNGLASGEVGQHLHLHPASGVLARMEEAIEPWTGVTQGYYVDRWERGYLLQTFTTTPDQVFVGMPWSFGEAGQQLLLDLRYMASAGPLVHDVDSVGSVGERLLRYDFGEQDRATMIAGLRECVEVFFAAGAREVYPGVVGARPLRSMADLDEVLPLDLPVGRLYLYASHPMGTCRMGADPKRSVVDPDGRVWGWRNLHVADASVFPTSLGVNPQVTTMAVGLLVGAAAAEGMG